MNCKQCEQFTDSPKILGGDIPYVLCPACFEGKQKL